MSITELTINSFDKSINLEVIGGPPGSGANRYLHNQTSPADEWIINHNLGVIPAGITVYSPGGVEVIAEIIHMSVNQLRVYFGSPQTGTVSII